LEATFLVAAFLLTFLAATFLVVDFFFAAMPLVGDQCRRTQL
jgi:hypothetical protein